MITMEELLRTMVEKGGSDLHISANSPPRVRVDGALAELPGQEALPPEHTKKLLYSVLDSQQIARFEQDWELVHSLPSHASLHLQHLSRSLNRPLRGLLR